MSVVGLTFGSGANAIRPSAASAGQRRDHRDHARRSACARSYQAKPAASAISRIENAAPAQRHGATPRDESSAQQLRALLGRERAAQAAEHARRLGGEVPAAGEHLARGTVGDHAAVGEQHDALGDGDGELRVVGRDDDRAASSACRRSASSPFAARSMPRVGSSRHRQAGGCAPSITIASASRWRWPPERSRGWRSTTSLRPTTASAVGARLVARRARAGGSRRGTAAAAPTRPRARTRPRVGSSSPAAWRSSVDLPAPLRPISATRSPGSTARSTPRRIARPPRSSCQTPVEAPAPRRARARRGAAAGAAGGTGRRARRRCSPWPRSVARASRTDAGGGRRPARANSRAAGVCSAGARSAAHARRSDGGASHDDRAVVEHDDAVGVRPGSARAGARRARPPSPTPR